MCYIQAKFFHPTSIITFLLKTMTTLVDRYMRDKAVWEHPLHSHHETGKSLDMGLYSLIYKIERALKEGLITLAGFLDIENVSDSTTFESMCNVAEQHGME
jgi:hypothetical protein